jgi:hypothetical protein
VRTVICVIAAALVGITLCIVNAFGADCYEVLFGERCAPPNEVPTPPPTGNNCLSVTYSPENTSTCNHYIGGEVDCGFKNCEDKTVTINKRKIYYRAWLDPLTERYVCTTEVVYDYTSATALTCNVAVPDYDEYCSYCD